MSTIVFSKTDDNTAGYPFTSHYQSLEAGKMHYIDEGEGETLLFVHGTPTWSYLYRDFITAFSDQYRCIAIDHMGFGLSAKPDSVPGSPQWHAQNLKEFITKMDLHNITLVVHDFGGSIGLAAGIENADRVKRVVLFNSWLWETAQQPEAQKIGKLVNSWLGKWLYLNLNISPKWLLKKGFADKQNLTKNEHQQYLRPFPTKASRKPLLQLAKSLVGSSAWYGQQWEKLHALENKPWLILWGTQDGFITETHLQKWQKRLPNATTHEFNCGHFVQEEATLKAIEAMDDFLTN